MSLRSSDSRKASLRRRKAKWPRALPHEIPPQSPDGEQILRETCEPEICYPFVIYLNTVSSTPCPSQTATLTATTPLMMTSMISKQSSTKVSLRSKKSKRLALTPLNVDTPWTHNKVLKMSW